MKLYVRAIAAFLMLPGIGVFVVPVVLRIFDPLKVEGFKIGLFPFTIGIFILLWCVRDFYVSGKGTLAPWDPPVRFVVVGLYRYTRNPMYLGVLTIVFGFCLISGSPLIGVYALLLGIGFHLRVVFYEEPALLKLFGPEWTAYKAKVPRWMLRAGLYNKLS